LHKLEKPQVLKTFTHLLFTALGYSGRQNAQTRNTTKQKNEQIKNTGTDIRH